MHRTPGALEGEVAAVLSPREHMAQEGTVGDGTSCGSNSKPEPVGSRKDERLGMVPALLSGVLMSFCGGFNEWSFSDGGDRKNC